MKNNRNKFQLFTTHRNINIPDTVLRTTHSFTIHKQKINNFPFIRWPNGKPCDAVNAFFLDKADGATGDSLKTYATKLTHLVRFCSNEKLSFEEINDAYFFKLTKYLMDERSFNNPTERHRDNNTVKKILSQIIEFLFWYQKSYLLPGEQRIIGERNESPRIIVRKKRNVKSGNNNYHYYIHRCMPTSESVDPKRPISLPIIENIEKKIDELSEFDYYNEASLRRHSGNKEKFKSQLEYIRARRHFMIWLMKRTGLRPAEMVSMLYDENKDVLRTKTLIIPTKKRRKINTVNRGFSITLKDALIIYRYFIARTKYINTIKMSNSQYQPPNTIFLSVDGGSIKKASIEKDFERIINSCGYKDIKVCFSMFRHRFITYEVIIHLKEFMGSTGKTRQLMTDGDYRLILKRVASKTGHGSEESLWHYIDIAWGELNVWGNVEIAITRLHAVDRLFNELLELKKDLNAERTTESYEIVDMVLSRLSNIIDDGKDIQ